MKIWNEIETCINNQVITHTTFAVVQDQLEVIRERMYTELMDLKDQATKDALIKLGWTPPKEDK